MTIFDNFGQFLTTETIETIFDNFDHHKGGPRLNPVKNLNKGTFDNIALVTMMLLAGEATHFGSSSHPLLSLQPDRPPILKRERTWHISHASGHGHAQSWFYL